MKLDSFIANTAEQMLVEMDERGMLRGNDLEENLELLHDIKSLKESDEPILLEVFKSIVFSATSYRFVFADAMREACKGHFFQVWRLEFDGCFFTAELIADADSIND